MKSYPNMGDFGLVHSLSFFYFISLAMLLCSFLLAIKYESENGGRIKYFIIILLLISFIFLTPVLIEETARFRYAYKVYGYTDYINRNGEINPFDVWYHNWPGAFFLISMLSKFIESNDFLFMTYFPFIIEILYFFPLYIFLKTLFQDEKKVWLGIWLFYIFNFINQDYMSPQALAYLFYLIFLSIVVKIGMNKNYDINGDMPFKFICILLFTGLVITHMMTPMIILSILIFSVLFLPNSKRFLYKYILVCTFILIGWTYYGAHNYLNSYLLDFIDKSYEMDLILEQNLENRVVGSPAHLIVSRLMIFTAFISIFFSAIGIFLSYYKKDKIFTTINLQMIALIGAILLSAFSSSYGGELIMRVFLFTLPFVSFFIPQIFGYSNTKIFLILLIILLTPLNIVSHYGNEKYDYVSKAEIVSYDFFYNKIDDGNITGGFPSYAYKFPERYNYLYFKNMEWNGNEYTVKTGNHYNIMIARGDKVEYELFNNNVSYINDIQNNILNSNNYVYFYSNGDMNMYKNVNN